MLLVGLLFCYTVYASFSRSTSSQRCNAQRQMLGDILNHGDWKAYSHMREYASIEPHLSMLRLLIDNLEENSYNPYVVASNRGEAVKCLTTLKGWLGANSREKKGVSEKQAKGRGNGTDLQLLVEGTLRYFENLNLG